MAQCNGGGKRLPLPSNLHRPLGPVAACLPAGRLIYPLTEYLQEGPNVIGSPFAGPAPIGESNLKESGWVSARDGSAATGDSSNASLLRLITGTSFGPPIFHHDDSILSPARRYDANGVLTNSFPLQPGKAYIFFITAPNAVRWRQAVPYMP